MHRTISLFLSVDYIYDFCPLPDPDVGLSILVCDVDYTSFHFGLCGREFVLCLFGQCPGLYTICHSWQHTGVVHMSLQADGNVAFEDIPVFGACRPTCHDSSSYLFVLVLFLEAIGLCTNHVIAGSTRELYTCLFRQMAMLILKISRCLAYAVQTAMILRLISLSWFFSLRL